MAAKKRRRKDQAPGWAWMLFGLSIGLAVALVVYLKNGTPEPELTASPAPPAAEPAVASSLVVGSEATGPADTASSEPPAGGAPATELEFYELLQEIEDTLPEIRRADDRADAAAGTYTIQAGAFRVFEEADRRQARLALLGIEGHIERAIVGNDIWHRVIIGPLSDQAEINGVLRKLRAERIEVMQPQPVRD